MNNYPYYNLAITLDNGMNFAVQFGPAPGLPPDLEDDLAVCAANAIQNYNWTAVTGITPPITSATVVLSRVDIASTGVPLS